MMIDPSPGRGRRLASEFAVVFLGVLLALAADQAWDWRQDRVLEEAYYASLQADLERDTAEYRSTFDFHRVSAEVTNQVLDAAVGDGMFPADARRLYRAGYLDFPYLATATIDELMASGNIRLLRNVPIKAAMSAYYRGVNEWKPRLQGLEFTEAQLEYRRMIQPLFFQLTPREGVPVMTSQEVVDELQRLEGLPHLLGFMLENEGVRLSTYEWQLEGALTVLDLLAAR